LILSALAAFAQKKAATPVYVGTWKLVTARSSYSPGPAPKSQTSTISAVDNGMKVVVDRVEADGKKVHFEWTAKFDGKDYPVKGDPSRDTVSLSKLSDLTLEVTSKKDGKVTMTITGFYSVDGKSRIESFKGSDPQGQKIENVTVWEKK
jgi:hypothetical protein